MNALKTPRLWLFVWAGLGTLFVIYVILAASVKPDGAPAPASAVLHDRSLLIGEMADFQYAVPPRGAPLAPFSGPAGEMTLEAFRGKVILVNFWATWCAPCLKELPSLAALEADLGGPAFEVVAIAADPRGPELAAGFLERAGAQSLRLHTDARLRLAVEVGASAGLPITILYDRRGREVGRLVGEADWASPEARALVKSVIDAG